MTFDIISPFSNVLTYLLTEVKYCTMLKLFMMSAFPHALVRLRKQYEIHSVIFIEMEIYRDGADVTRRGVCSRHESSGEREKLGHLQSTTVYDGRSADDDDVERRRPRSLKTGGTRWSDVVALSRAKHLNVRTSEFVYLILSAAFIQCSRWRSRNVCLRRAKMGSERGLGVVVGRGGSDPMGWYVCPPPSFVTCDRPSWPALWSTFGRTIIC